MRQPDARISRDVSLNLSIVSIRAMAHQFIFSGRTICANSTARFSENKEIINMESDGIMPQLTLI